MSKLEKSTTNANVYQFSRMGSKLNFDLAIQRKDNIWDLERKSLLIHSLIYDYPIGVIYCLEDENTKYNFLDGKQRMTTILSYLNDEFQLHSKTPAVDILNEDQTEWIPVEIAGLKFSELPEDFRQEINSRTITIYHYKNLLEDEIEEMFYRLNNGIVLTAFEKTRSKSSNIMPIVNDIANRPFFQDKIGITENMKRRYVDQELVLQILMLLTNSGDITFSGKAMEKFTQELNNKGISDGIHRQVIEVIEYLDEAIPEKMKDLKKVHIPMLFMVAKEAKELELNPEDFKKWAIKFFVGKDATCRTNKTYSEAANKGTGKSDAVQARLDEMIFDFAEWNAEREEDTGFTSEDLRTSSRVVGV